MYQRHRCASKQPFSSARDIVESGHLFNITFFYAAWIHAKPSPASICKISNI